MLSGVDWVLGLSVPQVWASLLCSRGENCCKCRGELLSEQAPSSHSSRPQSCRTFRCCQTSERGCGRSPERRKVRPAAPRTVGVSAVSAQPRPSLQPHPDSHPWALRAGGGSPGSGCWLRPRVGGALPGPEQGWPWVPGALPGIQQSLHPDSTPGAPWGGGPGLGCSVLPASCLLQSIGLSCSLCPQSLRSCSSVTPYETMSCPSSE